MFWRRRADRDFAAEIEAHVALETDRLVARGVSPEVAAAQAHRAFGSVTRARERFHEGRSGYFLERAAQDVRHAVRSLRATPAFTLTVLATLALGIGVNTAIFSMLYAVAVRPLPVRDPGRVVSVFQQFEGRSVRRIRGSPYMISYPEYLAYRDGNRTLEGLAVSASADLAVGAALAEPARGRMVSCNYFDVLRVRIAAGRGLTASDCAAPGSGSAVVVSDGFWRRRLGADPAAIGKPLVLDRQPFTVVGVAEPGFTGTELEAAELFVPVEAQPLLEPDFDHMAEGESSWLAPVGRLRPGVSAAAAGADLAAIAARRNAEHPGRTTVVSVERAAYLGGPEVRGRGALFAACLLLMAGLVVAMACTNVLGLMLARAAARQREIGVRVALGATPARLVAQWMTESFLLALAGGAAGVAIARWLPGVLLRALPLSGAALDLSPNAGVLAYALALVAGSALSFGLLPALRSGRTDAAAVVRGEGGAPGGQSRIRALVVGAQVAGCLTLLIVAGLLGRSVFSAQALHPGFTTERVAVVTLGLPQAGYDATRGAEFSARLRARLAAVPGVESVAAAAVLPLVSRLTTTIGLPGGDRAAAKSVAANAVSRDYFETLGIRLLRGRPFEDGTRAAGEVPAVVSAAMAARFWPSRDAVGETFVAGSASHRVVGVAVDVHNTTLAQADPAFFYAPAGEGDLLRAKILVRARDPEAAGRTAVALARSMDPGVYAETEPLDQALRRVLGPARAAALLCLLFGALAAAVAIVGLYGLVAYAIRLRSREIAVRQALGASARHVALLVVNDGLRVLAFGAGAGLVLAAGAGWLIRATLAGVSPLDPIAFAGMTALFGSSAAAVIALAALQAARRDPAAALRAD